MKEQTLFGRKVKKIKTSDEAKEIADLFGGSVESFIITDSPKETTPTKKGNTK